MWLVQIVCQHLQLLQTYVTFKQSSFCLSEKNSVSFALVVFENSSSCLIKASTSPKSSKVWILQRMLAQHLLPRGDYQQSVNYNLTSYHLHIKGAQ